MNDDKLQEVYRRYRPQRISDVLGQPEAVNTLKAMFQRGSFPHCLLFTGPSGTGKTTLARIVATKLNCHPADLVELNAADTRGIDTIRDLARRVRSFPLAGDSRVWIIDEAGKLSTDAQNAMLKLLEELPGHSYIFLATTDPQKLIPTVKTRCTEIRVRELDRKTLQALLVHVSHEEALKHEGREVTDEVLEQIIENSNGSARMALVLLNKVMGMRDEGEQLDAIAKGAMQGEAIALARCLFDFKSGWPDAAKILATLPQDEAESTRYLILGYARTILLKGGKMAVRAAEVITLFQFDTFNSKQAGLALMVWNAMNRTGGGKR